VSDMMTWFVKLDGTNQQNFIESLFRDKLRSAHTKSEESIGLLSLREGDASFHISNLDGKTLNNLRNILSAKNVKYISTSDEILFDIGHAN